MKLQMALCLALPILGACWPDGALRADVAEALAQAKPGSPTPKRLTPLTPVKESAGEEHGVNEGTKDDEGVPSQEEKQASNPEHGRKTDDEAAEARQKLASLRRRLSIHRNRNGKNETVAMLENQETAEQEEKITPKQTPAQKELIEEANTEAGRKPAEVHPSRFGRFGGGHQTNETSKTEVTNETDADAGRRLAQFHSNRFGRFGARHQPNETSKTEVAEKAETDIGRKPVEFRPSRFGRPGGHHQHGETSKAVVAEETDTDTEREAAEFQSNRSGHFGRRHRVEETSKTETTEEANADTGRKSAELRPGHFGRLGGHRQPDDSSKTELTEEAETDAGRKSTQFRPNRFGRLGGYHKPDETEPKAGKIQGGSESQPQAEEGTDFVSSTTAATRRRLTGLQHIRRGESTTQNSKLKVDKENVDKSASLNEEGHTIEDKDKIPTPGQSTFDVPQRQGSLQSTHKEALLADKDGIMEGTDEESTIYSEKSTPVPHRRRLEGLRSRHQSGQQNDDDDSIRTITREE